MKITRTLEYHKIQGLGQYRMSLGSHRRLKPEKDELNLLTAERKGDLMTEGAPYRRKLERRGPRLDSLAGVTAGFLALPSSCSTFFPRLKPERG
jgi:hypothetical protein